MNNYKKYLNDVLYAYIGLGVIFIPFHYYLLPFQQKLSDFLFGTILSRLASLLQVHVVQENISSDSATLYMLMLFLFILSILLIAVTSITNLWKERRDAVHQILTLLFVYFLSLHLLKYGFDKIFKAQFYLPEPNTLYTPLGQLSKDILFWSTMGTSYPYNLFMGLAELIPAVLLLFKRTRVTGLIWAFAVLLNVAAINFSFDISVKIFSVFLLSLTVFLLLPQLKNLFQFLVLHKTTTIDVKEYTAERNVFLFTTVKVFMIGVLFLEGLYPYIMSGNYNDDKMARPDLHGAYEVKEVWLDSLKAAEKDIDYKRFFIHRKGYLIVQYKNEHMSDVSLITDTLQHRLITRDQEGKTKLYSYSSEDSILTLVTTTDHQRRLTIKAKALNWKALPALQHDFHWTIDQVH